LNNTTKRVALKKTVPSSGTTFLVRLKSGTRRLGVTVDTSASYSGGHGFEPLPRVISWYSPVHPSE